MKKKWVSTYAEGYQTEHLAQQRKKRWRTNCVKFTDDAVNHWILCSILLEEMFGWKRKVSKTSNENAVKCTVWLYYERDWNEYVIIWQASANEMMAVKCQE